MKLRNKKTGEIKEYNAILLELVFGGELCGTEYDSIKELTEEWEDYKEPKEYCYITGRGNLHYIEDIDDEGDQERKEIGNYFETKEEAEKAVEKLKAWKRLKDSGVRFVDWYYAVDGNRENGAIPIIIKAECKKDTSLDDLDLLFGGKE